MWRHECSSARGRGQGASWAPTESEEAALRRFPRPQGIGCPMPLPPPPHGRQEAAESREYAAALVVVAEQVEQEEERLEEALREDHHRVEAGRMEAPRKAR